MGTILRDHSQDDFPWCGGVFCPSEHFAEVRPLFDEELRLLNDSTDDSQWGDFDAVWDQIRQPGLRIVREDGSLHTDDPLIHIDGSKTWWR